MNKLILVLVVVLMVCGCGVVDRIEMGAKYDFFDTGEPVETNITIGFNKAETIKQSRPVFTGEVDGEPKKFYAFTEDETKVIMEAVDEKKFENSDNALSAMKLDLNKREEKETLTEFFRKRIKNDNSDKAKN